MPIRDLLVATILFGSLPVCFLRPWIGVLVWVWFGVMTPHRLTWGFTFEYEFGQLIAVATLAGILFARDRQPLPRTRETYILLGLWALFTVTTVFAAFPADSWEQWEKVSKILLFTFVGLVFLQDRARLRYLVLVLTLSIGFFGLKGGIWALMMGGTQRVEGPERSFIGGNNGLALGLDMALPILFFLAREESNPWLRRLLWTIFVFSIPAIVFTYSRGGFLGLIAVLMFIAVKTKRKIVPGVLFVALMVAALSFAPQKWFERAETIVSYERDGSAQGRLIAWEVAFRYALDHPVLGGGFNATAHESVYLKYLGIRTGHAPHSIWFSTLSEHGFTGLILFVSLLVCCIATLRKLRRPRRGLPPAAWVVSYSHMLEVSLVGYMVTGTFLNVAYINVFYWVVALVILLDVVAARERQAAETATPSAVAVAVPAAKSSGGRHVRYRWVR